MVHEQVLAQNPNITYKQLRKIEKLDAKKAREEKYFELANNAIVAGGRTAQGVMSNQLLGPLFAVLGLSFLMGIPATRDLVHGTFNTIASGLRDGWFGELDPMNDFNRWWFRDTIATDQKIAGLKVWFSYTIDGIVIGPFTTREAADMDRRRALGLYSMDRVGPVLEHQQ